MADHDETDTDQSMKDEMGTKATITITTGPEGFDIGLDFHGEKMNQNLLRFKHWLSLVSAPSKTPSVITSM
jgi:hypothetical protein